MAQRVLLVQTDTKAAQALTRYFNNTGDETWKAWNLAQAESLLGELDFQLMLVDINFPANEWIGFLQRARRKYPDCKIIITHKFPDLHREMLAREHGFTVFTRQPFTSQWLDRAIASFEQGEKGETGEPAKPGAPVQPPPRVRMPVRIKITLPYLILALIFALAGAYIVSQVVLESVQERYLNQLVETGVRSADWMVRQEDNMLSTLRLAVNSQGVPEAVQNGDTETLRVLVLPLAVNAGEELVEILNTNGVSLLSMRLVEGGGPADYTFSAGEESFKSLDFVQNVLQGQMDERGDKYAGVVRADWGDVFYISGPIYDAQNQVAGALLVGRHLNTLAREMKQETLAETTLYDMNGQPLASTLYTADQRYPLLDAQVESVLAGQAKNSLTRNLTRDSVDYTELLGPWEIRGGSDVGLLGVALAQSFLVRTSQFTRVQIFVLVAVGIVLVVSVGMYLARMITNPLQRLLDASRQVAQGNLEVKLETAGDDEISALASSFNFMVAGLQEGVIYRDLLGRTVSPEVREQLRQTFSSGDLRLAGQEAVATVLMADIRDFTTLSEKTDPAQVFEWLNAYYGQLVPIITAYGGVVNKFDGDAILAFFGILPSLLTPQESAVAACQAGLDMLDTIEKFNRKRVEQELPQMLSGIGINTGLVMAGGLGSSDRIHYTIIGDTVNTTQRLEALTRQFFPGSGIVISQSTLEALGDSRSQFNINPLGQRAVKGKAEQVQIYRLRQQARVDGPGIML